ncbi:GNAT family N-acetyltransferase [Paenibacillus donghaensis]|uniref:N-acetyltransferase domain-containing protein n=1 Tax=Paenibacillus donghaensis TaxID=414771 RepID=A0A2Z2KAJ0_9BACL|nr:GNAT family N-acetyltransferase [Paenibacillus donghaensis]ASA22497.1 hypothetical protein B9T62_17940 [Paenibacillus donghaensis]
MIKLTSPYEQCPSYETERLLLRLVKESDAKELLECYADPDAAALFNADNCPHNFICHTVEEMTNYITYWLEEYAGRGFVRFSVIDKQTQTAVGTVEMFSHAQLQKTGVMRIDLKSEAEKAELLTELLKLASSHFFTAFDVKHILTKAVPKATVRIDALLRSGYTAVQDNAVLPFADYYMK